MESLCLLLILITLWIAVTRRTKRTLLVMTAVSTVWLLATFLVHSYSAIPISL